ncbi:MAG: hypothetical protein NWF08_04710 [Candidatus Bathyarchaeota archaeon]|nr:hypothetical protein [Candidatus Bathyarchaeota archaeon]
MIEKKRNDLTLVMIIYLCIIIFQNHFIPLAIASEYSVARIVKVDYPQSVEPFQAFQVLVTAEYMEPSYVDVGIRDIGRDGIVQALTLISNFHGPGEELFIFNLTAPKKEGLWQLEAITRAWWRNAWYADPLQGTMKFEIQIEEMDREESILWAKDTVEISENARLKFTSWNDGVESNPRKVLIISDTIYSPNYVRQFYLEISSPVGFVKGGGWYDEGSMAKIEASSKAIIGDEPYFFKGWEGDIKSDNRLTEVKMNGAKNIEAIWEDEPSGREDLPNIILLFSYAFFIGSLIIASIFAFERLKPKIINLFLVSLIILSFVSPIAQAQDQGNTEVTSIQIQNTVWRYWHNPNSDTCIIWLGGGISTHQLFINPYWLESYNTMRFIQDLSKFYSILVIEDGSESRFDKSLQREVNGEIYDGGKFLERARKWIIDSGYSHIYLMGYSVGGLAVTEEVVLANPEHWSSPNGIILITTPIDSGTLSSAYRLQSNLLILLGEGMPDYLLNSSKEFYQSVPKEGLNGWGWLHKEFHIIPKVAHEVWTVAESGEYFPEAAWVVVRFIERSKVLSYNVLEKIESNDIEPISGEIKVNFSVVPCSDLEEPIRIRLKIDGLNNERHIFLLKPLIEGTDPCLTNKSISKEANEVLITIPKAPNKIFNVKLYSVSKKVMDLGSFEVVRQIPVRIKITTGFVDIPFLFDEVEYRTERDGTTTIETNIGNHTLEVPKDIELETGNRIYLKGMNSTIMTFEATENIELFLLYTNQFLVEANSDKGIVYGDGWYDENSTASLKIEPQISEEYNDIFVFDGWILEDGEIFKDQINVTKPLKTEAIWQRYEIPHQTIILEYNLVISLLFLILSIITFIATLLLVQRLRMRNKRTLTHVLDSETSSDVRKEQMTK